jgi:hypothetical protein
MSTRNAARRLSELDKLAVYVRPGIRPKHMDQLIRIARDVYEPSQEFQQALHDFEDYFERWGVCSQLFWEFHDKCRHQAGTEIIDMLFPQEATIDYATDDGEPEIMSPDPEVAPESQPPTQLQV